LSNGKQSLKWRALAPRQQMRGKTMTKGIWLGSLLVALTTSSTALAETVFMTVRGSRQGDIQGSGTQRGHEGAMQCTSYQSQIAVPASAAGGAAGRPQIDPIRCVKRVDRASPLLLNALLSNEPLTTVSFTGARRSCTR
jgi:hypothetical protein